MNWEKVQLGSLCTVVRGSSPRPKGDPRYYGGTIPRLMVSDVSRDGMYVTPSIDYLTDEGAKKSRPMKSGSVIIAVSGNPGEPTILMIDACIHDGFVGLRNLDVSKVHKPFLYSFLKYYKEKIKLGAVGAIYKNLTTAQIKSIEFPLFPLPIQKKIAAVLDKVDVLRQKDQALLDVYDQLGQSFFWEMFGDPVKNPKGWEVKKMHEICVKITDGTHHSPKPHTSGYPYVTAKHVKKSGLDFGSKPTFVSKEAHEEIYKRCTPEYGDILYIKDGATTGIACINTFEEPISMLSSLALLKTQKTEINNYYLSFWLNHHGVKAKLISEFMSGAAIKRYTLKKINSFKVLIPPLKLQNKFANIIQNIEAQKAIVKKQQEQSEALFQSLLQKAFKGELFGEGLEKTE